jgi:hypothetical protein
VGGERGQADKETEKGEDGTGREPRRPTTKEMEDQRLERGEGFSSRDYYEQRGAKKNRIALCVTLLHI